MYVPNFAAEQPGATYYYSPLNVYPFGVVDASAEPTMLNAFVYNKGESFYVAIIASFIVANASCFLFIGDPLKGGNQVASMLWKLLRMKGLLNGITLNEINFVFDNCGGQNKNRMVYRMLTIMVKLMRHFLGAAREVQEVHIYASEP